MQGCHEGGWVTGAACPGPPLALRPNSVYSRGASFTLLPWAH